MTGDDKKKMARTIVDAYVKAGSPQEINIDALTREAIVSVAGNNSFSNLFIIFLF